MTIDDAEKLLDLIAELADQITYGATNERQKDFAGIMGRNSVHLKSLLDYVRPLLDTEETRPAAASAISHEFVPSIISIGGFMDLLLSGIVGELTEYQEAAATKIRQLAVELREWAHPRKE